jgi:hypothetical protein
MGRVAKLFHVEHLYQCKQENTEILDSMNLSPE